MLTNTPNTSKYSKHVGMPTKSIGVQQSTRNLLESSNNLTVKWCEDVVQAIMMSDYKTKLAIIQNMRPSDDESKFAKERNKKLRELKIRLKEIDEDIMEKERLIDEFLKETSIFAQNVMIENDAFYC